VYRSIFRRICCRWSLYICKLPFGLNWVERNISLLGQHWIHHIASAKWHKAYSNGSPYQPPSPYVRGTVFPLAPPTAHAIPSPHAGRARSSPQMWREYDLPPRAGGRWRAGSRERKELRGEAGGAGKLRDSASCWRRRKRALRRWRWRARGRRRPPPRG